MVTGIVNNLWTKTVPTRNGNADVHLMSLEGDDRVFNLAFKKPVVQVGDDISFSDNGEKYGETQVDLRSLKVNSRGNPTSAATVPETKAPMNKSGSGGYSKGKFPLPIDDGQRCILRQHAFTQASEAYRHYYDGPEEVNQHVDNIIELAYKIEHYTSGDDVREEMENGE